MLLGASTTWWVEQTTCRKLCIRISEKLKMATGMAFKLAHKKGFYSAFAEKVTFVGAKSYTAMVWMERVISKPCKKKL